MESVVYEGQSDTQGGGHGRISKCKVMPGSIPAISKPLDHREGDAYKSLQDTPLKAVIPKFYGIHDDCIIISDVTEGFRSPCLADLKVGTRHYDPSASEEKKQGLIAKQKGSTTDSVGVRLIDAKIRENGEVTKAWDRKQGLKFSEQEFAAVVREFVPPSLQCAFIRQLNQIYDAFDKTVSEHPGFRMYAASVLIAYDGDSPTELRTLLIDFAHTHMSLDEEGYDSSNEEYDDGVVKGLTELINIAETDECDAPKTGITYTVVEDDTKHKKIKKCVVQPGNHKCIMRPKNDAEAEAYATLQGEDIIKFMPVLYGIQDGYVIVQDICGEFASPCIMDFRLASRANEPGVEGKEARGLSVIGGATFKDKALVKAWKREDVEKLDDVESIKAVYEEFLPEGVAKKVKTQLQKIKKVYEAAVKETPGFRIYGASILIAYDGDDEKKEPAVAINRFEHSHLDIAREGYDAKDPKYDDGFVKGIETLLTFTEGSQSKCCILI